MKRNTDLYLGMVVGLVAIVFFAALMGLTGEYLYSIGCAVGYNIFTESYWRYKE